MDKIVATMIGIVAVVVVLAVIVFADGGLADNIGNKSTAITTQMNGLDYTGN